MNKIKQGYKQTDIGVIPEDWEVKSVDETFRFLNNATYSRAELDSNGTTGYIHYGDIHTKFYEFLDFDQHKLPCISDAKAMKYKSVQDGDIVMADASEDYTGLCKSVEIKNIKSNRVIAGLHTILIREKTNKYKNGFKGFLFLVPDVKRQLIGLATGMKVYGVSKSNLPQVLLPIPTLKEQTAIASALSDTNALIAALDKKIAKKQQIKQGAMQQLLTGKKRLPGFSGEWVEDDLMSLGYCIRGVSYNPNIHLLRSDRPDSIILLRSNNIYENKLLLSDIQLVVDSIVNENQIMIDNDILICMANGSKSLVGKCCLFNGKSKKFTFGAFMGVFRCHKPINNMYVFYYMQINEYRQQIDVKLAGSSINNLNGSDVESIKIKMPSNPSERIQIAQILTDMDHEIAQLEKERDKCKVLKAGMMQVLLTGTVRLA